MQDSGETLFTPYAPMKGGNIMKEKRNDSIELQVEIKTKDGREKVTLKFPE